MYSLVKPFLFGIDEERAHHLALSMLAYTPACLFKKAASRPVTALGLNFEHPVGLAAGFDKDGKYLDALAKLGFAFIELGTVTPKPQNGNPKPRLFRIPEAQAIINRMGFNNQGVEQLVKNVNKSSYQGILGINIGKNKDTALDHAVNDYSYCYKKVYPFASYVTINISSPNTPDLRLLQQKEYLQNLLITMVQQQQVLAEKHQKKVPLLIKISPDESEETLKAISDLVNHYSIDGVIASNTTCSRQGVEHFSKGHEKGGLSGKPLQSTSVDCLKFMKNHLRDEVVLIGVGGVDNPKSAQDKLDAGASLVQIYSSLIYKGPNIISEIVEGIR